MDDMETDHTPTQKNVVFCSVECKKLFRWDFILLNGRPCRIIGRTDLMRGARRYLHFVAGDIFGGYHRELICPDSDIVQVPVVESSWHELRKIVDGNFVLNVDKDQTKTIGTSNTELAKAITTSFERVDKDCTVFVMSARAMHEERAMSCRISEPAQSPGSVITVRQPGYVFAQWDDIVVNNRPCKILNRRTLLNDSVVYFVTKDLLNGTIRELMCIDDNTIESPRVISQWFIVDHIDSNGYLRLHQSDPENSKRTLRLKMPAGDIASEIQQRLDCAPSNIRVQVLTALGESGIVSVE